ncbi:MAG: glycerate kinase [Erysipelotrichaceae bacterium]
MKKFIIAPDSFKECMSAFDACQIIEEEIRLAFKDATIICKPMADGGEGIGKVLQKALNAEPVLLQAKNAYNKVVQTHYYLSKDTNTAIIEMATICGLEMILPSERNLIKATSYGLGQLIKHAIDHGAQKVIVGLGGSACNDGGLGMLEAMGAQFFDHNNNAIPADMLHALQIKTINLNTVFDLFKNTEILIACDVDNPYIGPDGATRTFGKQKGGTSDVLDILENNLTYLNEVFISCFNQDLSKIAKTGAAGGTSGTLCLCGAQLCSGIDLILKETSFETYLMGADYCFTGEGSVDSQTIHGKTISGIASLCKKHDVKLIVVAGCVKKDVDPLYHSGVTSIFSIINEPKTLESALDDGKEALRCTIKNICNLLS